MDLGVNEEAEGLAKRRKEILFKKKKLYWNPLNAYSTGGIILIPPLGVTPTENIWRDLENNLTPKKKFAREAREKKLSFFRAVLQGKIVQNGKILENIITPSQTFSEIWEIT